MASFSILTVCSGNVCRSPFAEQLLRNGLKPWPEVTVSSAGTVGLTGQPMPEQAAALSRRYGGDPSEHIARELSAQHIADADLVFAMSREHRRAIVELVPRAIRYTFTIREFARLVSDVTDVDLDELVELHPVDMHTDETTARFHALVELAASQRGAVAPPESPVDDDVVDPYRQSDDVYDESARQLVPAVDTIVSLFQRTATVRAR
ncbi:low molecular weight phosphatase family protein [Glaciibacter superstes]|uniref:arsenate reductase/protein-tyrosine-phosphatase family protein n=1 Tax=Glaciibacter superstes TaxID=501023 RepID=UPI0003B34391|nr:low molecular weight phosphatase family protein [Glaciibacter superstes]